MSRHTNAPIPKHRTAPPLRSVVLALAALAAAGSAHAQGSVTLYGLIDTYVEHRNHVNATGDAVWLLGTPAGATGSGGMNTSRWGMRGSEDLGGGLTAIFNLEGELSPDTGAGNANPFSRQAWVGLEGGFGRLLAGRSYTTTYDFILPFDPLGYAPIASWGTAGTTSGGRADGMITGLSNQLKYRYTLGGFRLGASYGFGEQATSASDSATYNLAVGYTVGGLGLVATAERQNGNTTTTAPIGRNKRTAVHLGASYEIGPVKFFAVARDYKLDPIAAGPDNKSTTYWVGAAYKITVPLTLTLAYYKQDIKDGVRAGTTDVPGSDPSLAVLRARYAMSKRTDVYAVASYAAAKRAVVGISRDDAGFDDNQTSMAVGIQHRF